MIERTFGRGDIIPTASPLGFDTLFNLASFTHTSFLEDVKYGRPCLMSCCCRKQKKYNRSKNVTHKNLLSNVVSVTSVVEPVSKISVSVEPVEMVLSQVTLAVLADSSVLPVNLVVLPVNSVVLPVNSVVLPVNSVVLPVNSVLLPVISVVLPEYSVVLPVNSMVLPVNSVVLPVNSGLLPDTSVVRSDPVDNELPDSVEIDVSKVEPDSAVEPDVVLAKEETYMYTDHITVSRNLFHNFCSKKFIKC